MCPSLIQIGSKTAEKNSAQTNRQTDRQTDTTKIMVTWPWTNIAKKLLQGVGYIYVAESLGKLISSSVFTQCAPKATEFAEITQNDCHYTVQGHSRSPILIPIESSGTTSYQWLTNLGLPSILHRFRDIAFDRSKIDIPVFGYPCCVYLPRRRGSPGTISVTFLTDVNGWPRYLMP